jgi:hypothetical protein
MEVEAGAPPSLGAAQKAMPAEEAVPGGPHPQPEAPAAAAAPVEAAPAPAEAAPQEAAQPQEEAGDAKRAQRRERHRAEAERKRRWDIRRSLADISADVELLTQEARMQHLSFLQEKEPFMSRRPVWHTAVPLVLSMLDSASRHLVRQRICM